MIFIRTTTKIVFNPTFPAQYCFATRCVQHRGTATNPPTKVSHKNLLCTTLPYLTDIDTALFVRLVLSIVRWQWCFPTLLCSLLSLILLDKLLCFLVFI